MAFRVTIGDRVVRFEERPSPEDIDFVAQQLGITAEEPGLLERAQTFVKEQGAETAVRVAGGTVGGIVGAVPSPVTTSAAASIGATTEAIAQGIEIRKGTRKGFSLGTIGVEAGLTAIPGGKLVKGASVARQAAKEAVKIGGAEAAGAQARSLIERGEFASPTETAVAGLAGAAGGALGGGLAQRTINADAAAEAAEAAATAQAREGVQEGAEQLELELPRTTEQLELFDDAGRVKPAVVAQSGLTVEGATPRVTKALTDRIREEGSEAARLLARTDASKQKQRLFKQVAELFEKGEVDAEGLTKELGERNLTMTEFVRDYWAPTISLAGRNLGELGRLAKELKGKVDPDTEKLLARGGSNNRVVDFLQKLEDTRRALLISAVRTGVRNAQTQGIAAAGDMLEVGLMRGTGPMRDHAEGFLRALLGRREMADRVDTLLRERVDLRRKIGDLEFRPPSFIDDVPVLQATIGKLVQATTFINRWQEMFVRHAKFDGVVRSRLKQRGLPVSTDNVPDDILDEAVESALDITFANPNPGGLEDWINGAQQLRPISTFLAPFPRYMGNAATYIARRNPLGLARLAIRSVRNDPEQVKKILAEQVLGTMLLGGALGVRLSDAGGEKWHDIKVGDKRFDIRGSAGPFAPYFFVADAFVQMARTGELNYTSGELVEAVFSMNRLGGTLAVIARELNNPDPDENLNLFAKMAASWISGFAQPLTTFSDLLAIGGLESEQTLRETRDEGFLAEIQAKIPIVRSELPPRIEATTGKPVKSEDPFLFGAMGLASRKVDVVEAEMDRLSLSARQVVAGTGNAKANREIIRRVGKIMADVGPRFIGSPGYQALNDAEKIIRLKELWRAARRDAMKDIQQTNPALVRALKLKRKLTIDEKRRLRAQGLDPARALDRAFALAPETED